MERNQYSRTRFLWSRYQTAGAGKSTWKAGGSRSLHSSAADSVPRPVPVGTTLSSQQSVLWGWDRVSSSEQTTLLLKTELSRSPFQNRSQLHCFSHSLWAYKIKLLNVAFSTRHIHQHLSSSRKISFIIYILVYMTLSSKSFSWTPYLSFSLFWARLLLYTPG